MRQIGTLPTAGDAGRLADYLLAQGIKTRVEDTAAGAAIWVYEEDQVQRAGEALDEYARDPHNSRYDQAAAAAREVEKQTAQKDAAYRKNVIDVRSRWDSARVGRQPLSMLLLAASIVATVVTNFGTTNPWTGRLSIVPVTAVEGGFRWDPSEGLAPTLEGQPWRLITPIFVHLNVVHLVFNMSWLIVLGPRIETVCGRWWMLALVLLLAATSNLAQFYWSGPGAFGMSGVVYGLFGFAWMKSRFEHDVRLYMSPTNVVIMIGWLFLCMTGALGGIGNAAHVAGLGVGVVIGVAPTLVQRLRRG
jgi:rhomboid protease GlpG